MKTIWKSEDPKERGPERVKIWKKRILESAFLLWRSRIHWRRRLPSDHTQKKSRAHLGHPKWRVMCVDRKCRYHKRQRGKKGFQIRSRFKCGEFMAEFSRPKLNQSRSDFIRSVDYWFARKYSRFFEILSSSFLAFAVQNLRAPILKSITPSAECIPLWFSI